MRATPNAVKPASTAVLPGNCAHIGITMVGAYRRLDFGAILASIAGYPQAAAYSVTFAVGSNNLVALTQPGGLFVRSVCVAFFLLCAITAATAAMIEVRHPEAG